MTILDEIAQNRRRLIAAAEKQKTIESLKEECSGRSSAVDVIARLEKWPPQKRAIIAEIKRQSPSKGPLWIDLDPAELAKAYERAGAFAISVLIEPDYFKGSVSDLKAARQSVGIPLLYKDFVVSFYQLWEARASGADMVLLIVALLGEKTGEYIQAARQAGLEPLIEVHDAEELETALDAGARLVGINNRNLKTFKVDIATTRDLLPKIPPGVFVVSESGLKSPDDLDLLAGEGARAFLIGETLVKSGDPENTLAELVNSKSSLE